MRARTSGGSLSRASTVTPGRFFTAGITFARSFVQNSSTSDETSNSSVLSVRPFCTSRFWTSTVTDPAWMSWFACRAM